MRWTASALCWPGRRCEGQTDKAGSPRHPSLHHEQDDSRVLDRLGAALDAGPDPHLLSLKHCTGCATCGGSVKSPSSHMCDKPVSFLFSDTHASLIPLF